MVEEFKRVIESYLKNASLTDATLGTVSKVEPLEVTLQQTMLPIPKECLYLTSNVIEKSIDKINHTHTTMDGSTSEELTDVQVYENGKPLGYTKDNKIIINKGLEVGNIVLLLRVKKGERYIVLSRLY